MNNWKLVDAEKINKENPLSFEIPCLVSKKLIRIGDFVKVIFEYKEGVWKTHSAERMWVKVTAIYSSSYMGYLKNAPFEEHILEFNDEVVFRDKHIISIEPKS